MEYDTPWLNLSTVAIVDCFTDNIINGLIRFHSHTFVGNSGYQAILSHPHTNCPGQPGYEATTEATGEVHGRSEN